MDKFQEITMKYLEETKDLNVFELSKIGTQLFDAYADETMKMDEDAPMNPDEFSDEYIKYYSLAIANFGLVCESFINAIRVLVLVMGFLTGMMKDSNDESLKAEYRAFLGRMKGIFETLGLSKENVEALTNEIESMGKD